VAHVEEIYAGLKEKNMLLKIKLFSLISSISLSHSTNFFMEVEVKRGLARRFRKSG
jgi:hypothetical protein